jgi:hypothetical protein
MYKCNITESPQQLCHNAKVFLMMSQLCYTRKYLFYIPPIIVAWQCTTNQTQHLPLLFHMMKEGTYSETPPMGISSIKVFVV